MKSDIQWEKIGLHPHHGICIPLFSLKTKRSCGIGEFSDLIPLIDWCKSLHIDCIQLLPINDTGDDPSPYNPISSCALDPIYLSLEDLRMVDTGEFHEMNQEMRLDRKKILQKKLIFLRKIFSDTFSDLKKQESYQTFLHQNPWLETYALFKALKEEFEGKNWTDWPTKYPIPEAGVLDFYRFLQFHCFDQMQKVRAHATKQGVFIKGDVPILISPDSADVWDQRSFFKLEFEAGAPPDAYNPKGQKWGFPLFNWQEMKSSGFTWWHRRLKVASRLFHIYRIDHVVGFFRIWAIPKGKTAQESSFFPSDPSLWEEQGKELLEMMLDSTSMLPIAEDLGTIPPFVPQVLKQLGICGTKVMRWQKNKDGSCIPFDQYEPFSMTTVSTHDLPTLGSWWKNRPEESIPFAKFMHWSYQPILRNEERFAILHAAHHTSSLFHINLLPEYLALFPELVWQDPEAERINVPGPFLPTNWTYRLRPFLEEMTAHKDLTAAFTKIVGPL